MHRVSVAASSLVSKAAGSGVLVMLLAMLMFAMNDVMGKFLVEDHSVAQLMAIRSLSALVVLSPLLLQRGWRRLVMVDRPGLHALRSLLFAIDSCAFYFAVGYMPLADTMTYWLAAPIYVAAASPFLLGEKVGWRRWTAILVGFAGVLIALGPSSSSLSLAALIALVGSAASAFAMMMGRTLRATPDLTLIFWQLVGALIIALGGVALQPSTWTPLEPSAFLQLCILGVVAMGAHVLVSRALKLADAATVVPLTYTLLFWAVIFGWIFFGDAPKLATIVGATLIIASGLFIFFREQQLKKRRLVQPQVTAKEIISA